MPSYRYQVKVGSRTVAKTVKKPRVVRVKPTANKKGKTAVKRGAKGRKAMRYITTFDGEKVSIDKLEKMGDNELKHTMLDVPTPTLKKLSRRGGKVGAMAKTVLEWESIGRKVRRKR